MLIYSKRPKIDTFLEMEVNKFNKKYRGIPLELTLIEMDNIQKTQYTLCL